MGLHKRPHQGEEMRGVRVVFESSRRLGGRAAAGLIFGSRRKAGCSGNAPDAAPERLSRRSRRL